MDRMLFAPLGVCLLQMLRLEGGEGNGESDVVGTALCRFAVMI